ncbi:hypothetical protein Y032_0036g3174 [Ancylostoma ceylanicum]|uniref:Uncharacterized protein n=1 Tax=Ancylostoma ceylanicum TaxID=53326 RepID=A0A016UKQ1_9BILA|nr:hypothetical protein Y032_0036g3174 [Ancylostoma ceylanicum]
MNSVSTLQSIPLILVSHSKDEILDLKLLINYKIPCNEINLDHEYYIIVLRCCESKNLPNRRAVMILARALQNARSRLILDARMFLIKS